jgi:hypothetical protein
MLRDFRFFECETHSVLPANAVAAIASFLVRL